MSKTSYAHSPPPIRSPENKRTRTGQRSASETSRRIILQHPQEQHAPADDNLLPALDAALERDVVAVGQLFDRDRSTLETQLAGCRGTGLCKQDRLFAEK